MAGVCAGWDDDAGRHRDCQFDDDPPDHEFEGKSYCRFHLPMGEAGEGGKADWDDEQTAAISDTIIECIKADMERPEDERVGLDFRGVVVPGRIYLDDETIWWANFSGARFHEGANFRETRFHGMASFSGARFHNMADFGEARFQGGADFAEARFHGLAFFRETRFHGMANFEETQFHRIADFAGSPDVSQSESRQFNILEFAGARFGGGASFSNREFRGETDFSSCVFETAPDFHGSTLHQDTVFGGIDCFPDVTSYGADRAYRTLRLAMEQHRARTEEGMFFALEQKARRHGMNRFDPAYWLSLAYEKGSDYGLSVLRPLMWFAVGILASTFLLLCIGVIGDVDDVAAMAADALHFSARQTFLPFDALRSTGEVLEAYDFNIWGTGWLRVWGTVLTLFEGLAALLLILAVRWRYRR